MSLNLNFTFDDTYRHFVNGEQIAFHCHHYMTLFIKVAEKFTDHGGPKIMSEAAEESMIELIGKYIKDNNVSSPEERMKVGEEFYSVMGLGKIEFSGNEDSGEAKLHNSHVDEGWKQKWGEHHKFINHFTCGYVAAVFALAYDKGLGSYDANEVKSIVMGEDHGQINVKLR